MESKVGMKKVVLKKGENFWSNLSSRTAARTKPKPTWMITEITAYNILFFRHVRIISSEKSLLKLAKPTNSFVVADRVKAVSYTHLG